MHRNSLDSRIYRKLASGNQLSLDSFLTDGFTKKLYIIPCCSFTSLKLKYEGRNHYIPLIGVRHKITFLLNSKDLITVDIFVRNNHKICCRGHGDKITLLFLGWMVALFKISWVILLMLW